MTDVPTSMPSARRAAQRPIRDVAGAPATRNTAQCLVRKPLNNASASLRSRLNLALSALTFVSLAAR